MPHSTEGLHCPNPACPDAIEPAVSCLYGNAFQVWCPCCGMRGPVVGGKRDAVDAWKRIAMAKHNPATQPA